MMLKAATYTRFSSDNQSEKSIDDQLRNCHEFAEKQGWSIYKDYKDLAMSGKLNNRPGFLEMIEAAERGEFNILILDDMSRLSRSSNATSIVEKLMFFGVRVVTVGDGIDSNVKGFKIQVGMRTIMNNMFLDDLSEKIMRGLIGNALKGRNTGGRPYGYYPVPVRSETELDKYREPKILYTDMAIDHEQAKWVKQIFNWVAEGRPYIWIAKKLNELVVPTMHKGNWTTSTLCGNSSNPHSGILNNPIYIGKKYYNLTKVTRNEELNKSITRLRDEDEWIVFEREDLRIIAQDLWDKVKEVQKKRSKVTKNKQKQSHKNARSGPGHKFLLSGIIKCSECGDDYITIAPNKYGCRKAYREGTCENKEKLHRDKTEASLLESIKKHLFQPDSIKVFREEVARLLKAKKKEYKPELRRIDNELKEIDKSISKLIDFITESDNPSVSIMSKITELEMAQEDLKNQKADQSENLIDIEPMLPRAIDKYHELVQGLPNSCMDDIHPIREQVKKLLGGEVIIAPKHNEESEGTYRGSFSGLLGLVNDVKISDVTLKGAFLAERTKCSKCRDFS